MMRHWIVAAFAASVGLAAAPAGAVPVSPQTTVENPLVQPVIDGCPRGAYRYYGRCTSNSRRYRSPRYDYGYYNAPQYYVRPYYEDSPSYYDGPGYYDGPRYDYVPRMGCPPGRHPGNSGRCVPNW